ncbi:hypothetical protein [Geobacter pickeringii]|uniref:Lipoprotein n=1 Tax=Geobacter pickeringii TaxID=345632 RepID=A0A0B5BGZ1_9BACT|nr:hypothetical protein [Geobacter pickeringii]AJE03775.1 hypothetical protein GPICK_10810 [Geobacter pickeringii]
MEKYISAAIGVALTALAVTGCGGGGGGGGGAAAPAAVTRATTKVYLFGTMSSSGKFNNISTTSTIATVSTKLNVPSGVLVNYSSAPGATSGLCILRPGVLVPSGPVRVATTDLTGTYDIASRTLTVSLINSPGQNQVALKTSSTGTGAEIATINFSLATAGVTPSSMPLQDLSPSVGQYRQLLTHPPTTLDNIYLTGDTVNFATTYQ